MLAPRTKYRISKQHISHHETLSPMRDEKITNDKGNNNPRRNKKGTKSDDVKYEDIVLLTKRKQRLLDERNDLYGKLNDIHEMLKDPERFIKNIDKDIYVDLELIKMKYVTDNAYNKLLNLKFSDRAAIITELQGESLIYHQELKRVQIENRCTEANLRKIDDQIGKLKTIYTESNYFALVNKLNELEKKIEAQLVKNRNYKDKIDRIKIRQQNAAMYDKTVDVAVEELRKQIKKEEDFIKKLDQEMETEGKKYMEKVQAISSA